MVAISQCHVGFLSVALAFTTLAFCMSAVLRVNTVFKKMTCSCAIIARGADPKLKLHLGSVIAGSRKPLSVLQTEKCDVVEIWPMYSASIYNLCGGQFWSFFMYHCQLY